MKNNIVICIGRQFGSGGREIGKQLAKFLNVPFYDKEILTEMAKNSGIDEELIKKFDEKPNNSLLYTLSLGTFSSNNFSFNSLNQLPLSDKVFLIQSDTIKKLSQKSCVIVGRCADSILNGENIFKVFICADDEYRVSRICENEHITEQEALNLVRKMDKKRASYHNFYSDTRWGEAYSYDLCINSKIGIENTVNLIAKALDNL